VKVSPLPLFVSLAFAAACGRTELVDPPFDRDGIAGEGGCGDGIVAPAKACDAGSEPTTPVLELRQGAWSTPVQPIEGPVSATTHYAYGSRSSHTGFEAPGGSSLYLYRSRAEAAMSLIFLNGIDEDSSGMIQPPSNIVFEIAGLPDSAVVIISDDDVELSRTTPATARAEWDCNRNSDGGVIGGLPFPGTWHLTITPAFLAGITAWTFLSGAQGSDLGVSTELSLDLSEPVEIVASDRVAD